MKEYYLDLEMDGKTFDKHYKAIYYIYVKNKKILKQFQNK